MQITKSYLKRIIEEETNRVLESESAQDIVDRRADAVAQKRASFGGGEQKQRLADRGSTRGKYSEKRGEGFPLKNTPLPRVQAVPYKKGLKEGDFEEAGEEIRKHGTEGVFTKKADLHNMTVEEFANHVLDHIDDYSKKTDHEAEFAKGAETVAKNHDHGKRDY